MRKIFVALSVSVDGYVEGPGRDISWHHVDLELHRHFNEHLAECSAFLDGRVTHQLMAGFWPTADADPDAAPEIAEFARIWRDTPKFVFSSTFSDTAWNTTIVREVVPDQVRALKALPGADMALGGARLAASFAAHGLIDEYWLYVNPVVLGAGTPLFGPGHPRTELDLLDTRRFGDGVVLLRFRVRAGTVS
jgi:dihydrofolate reductase